MIAEVDIRPAEPHELRLVASTWSRSVRSKPYAMVPVGNGVQIRGDLVLFAHARLVDHLLVADITAQTIVAVRRTEGAPIAGWACFSGAHDGKNDVRTMHYVFVFPEMRRAGVGRALWDYVAPHEHSHMTDLGRHLVKP